MRAIDVIFVFIKSHEENVLLRAAGEYTPVTPFSSDFIMNFMCNLWVTKGTDPFEPGDHFPLNGCQKKIKIDDLSIVH